MMTRDELAKVFKPTATDEVRRAVAASFPPSQHAEVLAALSSLLPWEGGECVRQAILVLANGDIDKLRAMLAKLDWRDVLVAATDAETPKKRREMAARYRRLGLRVPGGLDRDD